MDEFEPQKKDKIFTKSFISKYLYIIVIGLVVLFGTSYSLTFFVQDKKITSGSLTTAPLNITFSNKGIDASNLTVPANDQEGINEYVKSLTITNTSAVDGNVKLTIDRTSGLQLSDLRYSLSVNGTILDIVDMPSNGVILDTAIFSSETINVEVRLWPKPTYSGSTTIFQGDILSEVTYLKTLASSYSNLGNKYVNFNCNGTNCEVWRIVKVENGRLVLTREADLSGADARVDSGKYNPSLTFNDNSMITSVSTDNKNVYLAKTVKIKDGEGTQASPYNLININYSNQDEKVIAIITYDNDGDTTTQPIYYGHPNYISQDVEDLGFVGWTTTSGGTSVDYQLGEAINITTDTTLYAVIKNYLSNKIYQLCNDSSVEYVEKYNTANGQPIDTPDGSGNKDVCFYTSETSENLAGQNSNVIFGDYCWQIVRTTATGGVKLVYNGLKTADDKCTSDTDANYSSNPRPTTTGFVGTTGTTTNLSGDKVYGTGFIYSGTTFTLTDTFTANWSGDYDNDGNPDYEKIIGTYTCKNTSSSCTTLYYVGNYQDANTAGTASYTIGTIAHYSQIGTSVYNAYYNSPALVGYMYNDTYNVTIKTMTTSSDMITITSMSSSTAYYYGDTATWNPSTSMYDLTISGATPSATTAWNNIYSTAAGMYTCRNTTDTSCATVYYIEGASSSNMYNMPLSNNESISTKSIIVGTGYEEVNGSYNLTGTTSLLLKDWYANYSQTGYKNVYICSDYTSSNACGTLYYITGTSNYKIAYNSSANKYLYANSYIYQNGEYKLKLDDSTNYPYQEIWDWYHDYNKVNSTHYTCFGDYDAVNNSCGSSIKYVTETITSYPYYVTLTDGKSISNALDEMLNTSNSSSSEVNKYNSAMKGLIDNWYKANMTRLTSYLDNNAVYCNDRSIGVLNGWSPTGNTTGYLRFNLYNVPSKINASLSCVNISDRFSVNNNKAKLTYPVGLLSEVERAMMVSYYAKTGQNYRLGSPYNFSNNYAHVCNVYTTGDYNYYSVNLAYGVRPAIVLKSDVEITGSGTYTDPYVVNTETTD